MDISTVHGRLANTTLLYLAILAIWGFWKYLRKEELDGSYFGALVIGEVLILVQLLLGGYLWVSGERPLRGGVHILYGIVAGLGIPGVYIYTKGGAERRVALIYALVLLFEAIIAVRAIMTGG